MLSLAFFMYFFYSSSYSQKLKYQNKCDLVRNLLDSADRTFFKFSHLSKDSTITILDIDSMLTECSINLIGGVHVIIVNSGAEVEKIKRDGIFAASKKPKDLFIFTKKQVNELIGFRIYHPRSNGDFYWEFSKKNKRYYFKKKGSGWF
jgi:hypothetical protein